MKINKYNKNVFFFKKKKKKKSYLFSLFLEEEKKFSKMFIEIGKEFVI